MYRYIYVQVGDCSHYMLMPQDHPGRRKGGVVKMPYSYMYVCLYVYICIYRYIWI